MLPNDSGTLPILAAYAAVVAYAVFHHEPWFDEAQAWLVARDCDLGTLCCSVLRYEGHPVLWYLILKMAIVCHLPYEALGYLCGGFAVVGVGILLAKSPFPKPLAALLPFTFFLCYQYAAVGTILRAVAGAAVYRRHPRPPQMGTADSLGRAAVLLANLTVHTLLIAGGIMLIHTVELAFRWRRLDSPARKRQIAALSLFAVAALAAVVMLWPPGDSAAKVGPAGRFACVDQCDGTFDCDRQCAVRLSAADRRLPGRVVLLVLEDGHPFSFSRGLAARPRSLPRVSSRRTSSWNSAGRVVVRLLVQHG